MSLGEFQTSAGSNSGHYVSLPSIDPTVTTIQEMRIQYEGVATTAAQKWYSVVSVSGVPTATQVMALETIGPVLNVSANGAANTGAITTGNIASVGILHSVSTQRSFVVGGYIAAKDTGTLDATGDTLEGASMSPGVWGLLRYSQSGGWQQSVSTDGSAHRIWSAFGGAASSGVVNTIQLSNGSGGLASATGFLFNPTSKAMSVPGIGSAPSAPASGVGAIYADATGQMNWYDHSVSAWALFGSGGGGSVTSITGTTNQIVRSSPTGAVTLSIAATLTTSSFVSTSTTVGVTAFQNGSGSFVIDGIGNISTPGVLHTAGASSGVNVTGASSNASSIQTDGGMMALQVVATQATFGLNSFSPVSPLTVVSQSSGAIRGITSDQYSTDATSSLLQMRKARGTASAPTATTSGDVIGVLSVAGYDGSSFVLAAQARFVVDAAVSTGIVPTSYVVNTGTGSGGVTRMTISSAGLVTFGSTVSIDQSGNIGGTGVANFNGGLQTTNTASNAIQAPSGGVTALSLISIRNDGASGLTVARTSSVARTYGFAVQASGALLLNDDTAAAIRLSVTTAGLFTFGSSVQIDQAGNISGSAVANFTGGYLTAGFMNPTSGYKVNGTVVINSGASASFAGLSVSNSGAIVSSFTGQGNTFIVEANSGGVLIGSSTNCGMTFVTNNTAVGAVSAAGSWNLSGVSLVGGALTATGTATAAIFNSSAIGASLAFQAGSGTFQVLANGAISGASLAVSGNVTAANIGVSNQLIMVGQGSAPTGPSSGQFSFYANTTTGINFWNGSAWIALGSATGVTSAIAGTGVHVSSSTGAVTFSIGQDVSTGNAPTFNGLFIGSNLALDSGRNLTLGSGTVGCGAMSTGSMGVTGNVNATGSANFTSYLLAGSTLVNGTGAITCNGITTSNGITISSGGVTASAAGNFGSFEIAGVAVITSGRLGQFAGVSFGASGITGSGSISASGNIAGNIMNGLSFALNGTTFLNSLGQLSCNGITSNGGVQATGFNTPSGSGQTWTINVPSGFTISGVGGTFHNFIFSGGSLISAS